MMWLTIGVWACAFFAATCTGVVVYFIAVTRRGSFVALQAIRALGETHRLGLEVLTMDIDRLKERVTAIEADLL
jgi:hypothetical protein